MGRLILKLLSIVLLAISSVSADELTLSPQADTSSAGPSGRSTALQVDKNSSAFLFFNRTAPVTSIEQVTLELTLKVVRSGIIEIRPAGSSPSEKNFRRRPAIESGVLGRKRLAVKTTRLVLTLPAASLSNTRLTLALTTRGGGRFLIASRESKNKPRLRLVYSPIPSPTASVTPTTTGAVTATPPATATVIASPTPVVTPAATATITATAAVTPTATPASTPTVVSQTLVRGPYLQRAGPDRITVRWRTSESSIGGVRFGTSLTNLNRLRAEASATTEHSVELILLNPDTRYYYTLGTVDGPAQYASAEQSFVTAPAVGTRKPTRIWVLGDSGTGDAPAMAVRDAYINHSAGTPTDLWLMLGDNALPNGTQSEHQNGLFNVYPSFLKSVPLWPSIGNHDMDLGGQTYLDIFTLPTSANAGGVASSTEKYYSFNYANIHFVVLDSTISDRSAATATAPAGNMARWLISDLAANTQEWVIAFWHHPPYTNGSHNSDSEATLIQMRQNILPYLEDGGVDLVMSGHSHAYERSYFIDGYYGDMAAFSADPSLYVKQAGMGRADNGGAYTKAPGAKNAGAVFVVAGSSGRLSGGTLEHPAMVQLSESAPTRGLVEHGSFVLDVNGLTLDAAFLNKDGVVRDYFRIEKQ